MNVWKKTLVANNTDFNGIILAKINSSLLFVCLECLVCTPLNLIQPWSKLLMSLFLSFFYSFCSYEPNCVGNSLCQQQAHRLLLLLTNSNLSSIFYRFPSIQFQFLWDVCVCVCVCICANWFWYPNLNVLCCLLWLFWLNSTRAQKIHERNR